MKSEKAFTLVEVILAIGIFAIVAVPIVSIFLDGIKITSKTENTSEAYAYAQQYVEKLKGGEIKVVSKTDEPIEDTEYMYSIQVNSLKTEEELKAEKDADGEDFYKFMNDTDSEKLVLKNNGISYNGELIAYDNIKSIKIQNMEGRMWKFEKLSGSSGGGQGSFIGDITAARPYPEGVDLRTWIDYTELTKKIELEIDNTSGKPLNIYMQSAEENKNNLKIKNIGGIINVYGPVTEIPENRGRKKTANVTVIVKNTRTEEHAELTANVTYYE